MRVIYLVRHGEYDYRDSRPETLGQGLTERGRLQAEATGSWLSRNTGDIEAVLSSDYVRASQTADLIADAYGAVERAYDPLLRECADIYVAEGNHHLQSAALAFERVLGSTARERRSLVVVCHANLIRYMLARVERWPKRKWQSQLIPPCSISTVRSGTGTVLPKANPVASVRHLPPSLRDSI